MWEREEALGTGVDGRLGVAIVSDSVTVPVVIYVTPCFVSPVMSCLRRAYESSEVAITQSGIADVL